MSHNCGDIVLFNVPIQMDDALNGIYLMPHERRRGELFKVYEERKGKEDARCSVEAIADA